MAQKIPRAKALQAALKMSFRSDMSDIERLVAISRVTILDPDLSFIDQIDPDIHVYQDVEEWRGRVARLASIIEDKEQQIHELEKLLRRSAKKIKKPTSPATPEHEPDFNWTREAHDRATHCFLTGGGPTEVASLVGCNAQQARSLIYNRRLKFPFPVGAGTDPTDWAELWQIGSSLYKEGWLTKIVTDLQLPVGTRPPQSLNGLDSRLVVEFRKKYHAWEFTQSEKVIRKEQQTEAKRNAKSKKVDQVLKVIQEHANIGLTANEVVSILTSRNTHISLRDARRFSEELVKTSKVKTRIDLASQAQHYVAIE